MTHSQVDINYSYFKSKHSLLYSIDEQKVWEGRDMDAEYYQDLSESELLENL